jgi:hypothetical protein
MLKISAICDRNVLDGLHEKIFGTGYPKGVGYVLYDGEQPVGVAAMSVGTDVSVIEEIGILPEERGKLKGDFFTRGLIFGLARASETVKIAYENSYFEKFGFIGKNGGMICESDKVVFPCECHKRGDK